MAKRVPCTLHSGNRGELDSSGETSLGHDVVVPQITRSAASDQRHVSPQQTRVAQLHGAGLSSAPEALAGWQRGAALLSKLSSFKVSHR